MQMLNGIKSHGTVHLKAFLRLAWSSRYQHTSHLANPSVCALRGRRFLLLTVSQSRKWQSTLSESQKSPKKQSASTSEEGGDAPKTSKKIRSGGGKTSLRRVAVEAQRSRDQLIIGSKGLRFVNPDVETKSVTAYSAAEQYDIFKVSDNLRRGHFKIDPFETSLFPQVVHIQTLGEGIFTYATQQKPDQNETLGDVFIFPSGTVVTWNAPVKTAQYLLELIEPAAKGPHRSTIETEDLDFIEDPFQRQSRIVGDTIILGTKVDGVTDSSESPVPGNVAGGFEDATEGQRPNIDTVLAKIAFSSGFARSTKLAVLESRLDSFVESTRQIPDLLATMTRFRRPKRFSRQFMLQKTGELLSLRAQLNLYSELTDSLPDLFWDSRHELGLEGYYDMVGRSLDVGQRIRVLNERMDYAQEITSVLRETLNEKHGEFLEWLIIGLILIEVLFELPRFLGHWWTQNTETTDDLLRHYLEQELRRKE